MKFKIKKKHIGIAALVIVLILVIIGVLEIKKAFTPNETTVIYGSRLEGREKVTITEETKKQVKDKLAEKTSSSNVRIAGRIINITMVVKDGVSRDEAKQLGNSTLECFKDEEKAYYDIQIMINHETNKSEFPIIGYKHHLRGAINWTKDRTAG